MSAKPKLPYLGPIHPPEDMTLGELLSELERAVRFSMQLVNNPGSLREDPDYREPGHPYATLCIGPFAIYMREVPMVSVPVFTMEKSAEFPGPRSVEAEKPLAGDPFISKVPLSVQLSERAAEEHALEDRNIEPEAIPPAPKPVHKPRPKILSPHQLP